MSKTVEEVGLIVGGIALATVGILAGPAGILALQGSVSMFNAMIGIGVSTALAGVGVALRPNPRGVGTGNSISFQSGDSPRRVIYGQFQTAGVLTYASFPPSQNLAANNQYLHLIYTLCGHEISSFDGISVNGSPYNFGPSTSSYGDIVPSSGPSYYWVIAPGGTFWEFYWQHMFFEFDFGRSNFFTSQIFPQLADADSTWTPACQQRGCAKVHVWLRYDAGDPAIFPSGQIPNIQFLVTGKKIVDPRVITAWQPSTTYLEYQYVVDAAGRVWVQTNSAGVSGATSPPFNPSSYPSTETDNTCSWTTYGYLTSTIPLGFDANPEGHMLNQRLVNDAWMPATAFASSFIIEAPLGYLQICTSAGTCGSSEPTFGQNRGATTSDGGATWTCMGRSWHAANPSNSALVVNDYLQDTDAGLSVPLATIDPSATIAAANICEEQALIIWNADSSLVYENLYSCNGMFDHSSTRGDVLSALCMSMAGYCVPPGDLWRIYAGSYQTPTVSLGDADMRDSIKGDFRLSKREVANTIGGNYTPNYLPSNPPAGLSLNQVPPIWSTQKYPEYQANGLIWSGGVATFSAAKPDYLGSEDGAQVIRQQADFEFVTSVWQAQRLAKITLMRLRFQQTLTLPCKLTALQLEAGDTFSFTHLRWLILDQTFEVTQWSLIMDMRGGGSGSNNSGQQESPALGVDIVARQTDPSIYDFMAPSSSTNFGEYSPYGVTGVMTGVE